MQYLTKFNHLSHYAIAQVATDLKKKNCFMRVLNDQLQWKMVTYTFGGGQEFGAGKDKKIWA